MGRTLWTAALAFIVGVGVGAGLRGCGESGAATSRDERLAAANAPGGVRETSGRARAAAQAAESPREAVPTPSSTPPFPGAVAPDVREIPLAGAPTGFHEIDVEVVDADGAPAEDVEVYALPAGAAGTFDDDFVALAESFKGGRFRLRLPSPGTYDVRARTQQGLARIEDVAAPGANTLRLALPRAPAVVFVLDPESPPAGDVTFRIVPVPAPAARFYAGRSEPLSVSIPSELTVGPDRPRLEVPLAAVEFEIAQHILVRKQGGGAEHRTPERPAVFEPPRFVPPATVRVRSYDDSSRRLTVALTFAEPAESVSADRAVPLRLEFDGEIVEKDAWLRWDRRGVEGLVLLHSVRAPTGLLRWSGPLVVPGGARWDLDRSPRLEATVDVLPPSPADGVTVLVDLAAENAEDEGRVFVRFPDPDDPEGTDRALVPVGKEVVLDVPGAWLFVVVEDPDGSPTQRRVAGPVRARRGGRAVLKPRTGGYVVFAPKDVPPEGAGSIAVSRTDGAPFQYAHQGSDDFGCLASLDAGAILGPFEPGVVSLDVRVGSVPWGRYEVTVRENAWTTFTPRPFR